MTDRDCSLIYSELCASKTSASLLIDHQLENRLAMSALRALIVTLQDELTSALNNLTEETRQECLETFQRRYGEPVRFEIEDLLATPSRVVFN